MIRVVTQNPGVGVKPQVQEIEHSLSAMQKLVTPEHMTSGCIELVYMPELADEHKIDMYVNEEGKFNGCKANFPIFGGRDIAFGPVFFSTADDEGETVSLSDEQVKVVLAFLDKTPRVLVL